MKAGLVFAPSQLPEAVLSCTGHQYHAPLPDCVPPVNTGEAAHLWAMFDEDSGPAGYVFCEQP